MADVVRAGPLNRAQQAMWLHVYWREQGRPFRAWQRRWTAPPGVSLPMATKAIETLVDRHEVLRTIFVLGPDNRPVQIVFDPAGVCLPVAVSGSEEPHQDTGRPLLGGSSFTRLPWQVRLLVEGDEVTFVDFAFEHLVCDGVGAANWWRQFCELARGRDVPLPRRQPLDRQAAEARLMTGRDGAEPGRPDVAERAPQLLVPAFPEEVTGPRYLRASAAYQRLLPLLDEVCLRHDVSRPMVFMFVFGWLLSRYAGENGVWFSSMVTQRPLGDNDIDCQSLAADLVLEVEDSSTLREALTETRSCTLGCYEEQVRYGPVTQEVRARTVAARGVGAIASTLYNFQGPPQPASGGGDPGVEIPIVRSDHWTAEGSPYSNVVYVYVRGDDVDVDLEVDAAMLPASTLDTMLRLVPRLLGAAAERPSTPVRDLHDMLPDDFRRPSTEPWHRVGLDWANTVSAERLLVSAPGVRAASVTVAGQEVVADLSLEPGTDPFDVHEHVLTSLAAYRDVVAPSRYRPAAGGWWPADVPAAGWRPAADLPDLAPSTEAERKVCDAIRETHGHAVTNVALSYVAAGGRMVLGPALGDALRRRGLVGLQRHHLYAPWTLRAIARALAWQPPPLQ